MLSESSSPSTYHLNPQYSITVTMAIDPEKNKAVSQIEENEHQAASHVDKESLSEGQDDGKITLKTVLAVLSLIFMYEAYLFTLIM